MAPAPLDAADTTGVPSTAPTARVLAWRGVDPVRAESARVRMGDDRLEAHGVSTTAEYVLDYRLVTGAGWVTRTLDVAVTGDGWARSLALSRSFEGRWAADWFGDDVGHLALPAEALAGALDCDLGLCPLTNSMPIRRHRLVAAVGEPSAAVKAPVDLVMAWVSVPDLTIHASSQRYTATDPVVVPEGGALVHFDDGGFTTTIEVDAEGLCVTYPGLAYRHPG
jgi:hypothetical protein